MINPSPILDERLSVTLMRAKNLLDDATLQSPRGMAIDVENIMRNAQKPLSTPRGRPTLRELAVMHCSKIFLIGLLLQLNSQSSFSSVYTRALEARREKRACKT